MCARLAPPSLLARRRKTPPPDGRHERCTERILDQRSGNEWRYSDEPCLLEAELHANSQPGISRGKNDDVPETHRHEKPRHGPIPAALAQPSRRERREHEADEIS